MKKYHVFIILLFACLHFSCEDFLNTKSESLFTEESVFDTYDFAKQEVFSIYESLTTEQLYEYNLIFFKCDTDIECTFNDYDGARYSLAHYVGNSGSSLIMNTWTVLYKAIERANLAIGNLPKSKLWNNETYSADARCLYAEALTLRVLYYSELINIWGDVPFPTESTKDEQSFYLPKTDRDIIYERLVEDLKEAQEYLPWLSTNQTSERVTKGFAKGLRARIALACAGYSLRNGTLKTERGKDWEKYYQIARDECYEVMQSGKHRMNPDFENIFKRMHSYELDLNYGEIMFEVAFGRLVSGRVGQSFGMYHTTSPAEPKYGRAMAELMMNMAYFYTFDLEDQRRDVSMAIFNYGDANFPGKQRPINANGTGFRATKWRRMWINPSMGGDLSGTGMTGVNWPLMRYTDIVMMFAEAENQLNGPTDEAKQALMDVRKRAFPPEMWEEKVTQYVNTVSASKESFFNAIVDERGWEFGGEMLRRNDLVRWNLLGDKLDRMRGLTEKILHSSDDPEVENIPTYLYWKYNEDGESIDFLNKNYRLPLQNIAGYSRMEWHANMSDRAKNDFYVSHNRVASGFDKTKNNYLYPISNDLIVASNGVLSNDQMYPEQQ